MMKNCYMTEYWIAFLFNELDFNLLVVDNKVVLAA